MTTKNFTHKQKDELIKLTKTALELSCARLSNYEGINSELSNPEEWIKRAYFFINKTLDYRDD